MPSADEIQRYLTGAWRLMMGKPDGVRLLDVSADGFWNSFFALIVAGPAMVVGWVAAVHGFGDAAAGFGDRLSIMIRIALIDVAAWVAPLLALALAARRIGMADRYAHFVVASNWGQVLIVWLMLPSAILRLFLPSQPQVGDAVSLTVFLLAMVLTWRLTNAVIARGAGLATAVFAMVLAVSIMLALLLQSLLGLDGVA